MAWLLSVICSERLPVFKSTGFYLTREHWYSCKKKKKLKTSTCKYNFQFILTQTIKWLIENALGSASHFDTRWVLQKRTILSLCHYKPWHSISLVAFSLLVSFCKTHLPTTFWVTLLHIAFGLFFFLCLLLSRHPPPPPPRTHPPPRRWRPGTAGTQTPGRSCCSLPRWTPSHPCLRPCTSGGRLYGGTWR